MTKILSPFYNFLTNFLHSEKPLNTLCDKQQRVIFFLSQIKEYFTLLE